jgi:hypothetical protein
MPDPSASGRLRRRPVDIGGSVYKPHAVPQVIEEAFREILEKGALTQNGWVILSHSIGQAFLKRIYGILPKTIFF